MCSMDQVVILSFGEDDAVVGPLIYCILMIVKPNPAMDFPEGIGYKELKWGGDEEKYDRFRMILWTFECWGM